MWIVRKVIFMDVGIIIDLETTGLDPNVDQIIEIGILEFSVDGKKSCKLLSTYSALQESTNEIPTKITELTGIDSEMLKDRNIDWGIVRKYLERASIVIAHNVDFDRSFLERVEEISDLGLHWGCSLKHINWHKHGFHTRALNYLASDHGFVNPFSHRAIFDCATTFRLCTPYLDELIDKSYEREYELAAVGAAFDKKDQLKEQGYLWDSKRRVWHKVVFQGDLEYERIFLTKDIYGGKSLHREEEIIRKKV